MRRFFKGECLSVGDRSPGAAAIADAHGAGDAVRPVENALVGVKGVAVRRQNSDGQSCDKDQQRPPNGMDIGSHKLRVRGLSRGRHDREDEQYPKQVHQPLDQSRVNRFLHDLIFVPEVANV